MKNIHPGGQIERRLPVAGILPCRLCRVLACLLFIMPLPPAVSSETLDKLFATPPQDFQPRVWWHWMNGNITREGIREDLEWMERAGIGGVHTTDIGLKTPRVVADPVVPFTPQWRQLVGFARDRAWEKGIEFGHFSSPGWSLTGGPWVKPAQAMKKLVWSGLEVRGGMSISVQLPALPRTTGPFQDIAGHPGTLEEYPAERPLPRFGADSIVIAYRRPSGAPAGIEAPARIVSNGASGDLRVLTDDNRATGLKLGRLPSGEWPWITYEYDEPRTIRAVTLAARPAGTFVNIQVSEDGKIFRPLSRAFIGAPEQLTESFAAIDARALRFSFGIPLPQPPFAATAAPGTAMEALNTLFPVQEANLEVLDLVPSGSARVHRFEAKAGFQIARDYDSIPTPPVPEPLAVKPGDVVDLSGMVSESGRLDWEPPPGEWVILRMGYSLTGAMNHAAPPEATGLEVDKLSVAHVTAYFEQYIKQYGLPPGDAPGRMSLMVDSHEVGPQNWTDDMMRQFETLRGYDARPWLPVLTGVVVESAEASDRFLWDFRRTIADLTASSHYDTLARLAHDRNLEVYIEALESMRSTLGDDMAMRKAADVPAGALWTFSPDEGPQRVYLADLKGAASVAHIYGQNLVAGEILTSAMAPWGFAPRHLKPVADLAFATGMNRPLIHSSVHQPVSTTRPGFSVSFFGQNFNRLETWAELARPWMDYLSRCALLLQQGRAAADIAYFYGEEAPVTTLFGNTGRPPLPRGYDFDFLGPDALVHRLSVEGGELTTPSGMRYKALVLGGSSARMTVPVLRKLNELADGGARVFGSRPGDSPSLGDDPEEFDQLVNRLWGRSAGTVGEGESAGEAGARIRPASELESYLSNASVGRDFDYSPGSAEILFQHRVLPQGQIYFVSNRSPERQAVDAYFRTDRGDVELWHPDSGVVEPAEYREEEGRTVVPLLLEPLESLFVVFRGTRIENERALPDEQWSLAAALEDGWSVSFPMPGGDLISRPLESLHSWIAFSEEGLKYYSGTAIYRTSFTAPGEWFAGDARLFLDLGDVRELAGVSLNGTPLGTLWKPPYRVEITRGLRPGENTLEIRVTNLWVNRLIGDARAVATAGTTTSFPTYSPEAPLRDSGLLGPVQLLGLQSPEP